MYLSKPICKDTLSCPTFFMAGSAADSAIRAAIFRASGATVLAENQVANITAFPKLADALRYYSFRSLCCGSKGVSGVSSDAPVGYSLTCLSAAATAIANSDSAQRIRDGARNGAAPPLAAEAAATPKISTGSVSGSTRTAIKRPPRRSETVSAAPTAGRSGRRESRTEACR
jgi:hypothetical protein